jgi:hypothetical protein
MSRHDFNGRGRNELYHPRLRVQPLLQEYQQELEPNITIPREDLDDHTWHTDSIYNYRTDTNLCHWDKDNPGIRCSEP